MAERCNVKVYDPARRIGSYGCSRQGKVFDQDKWWCKQHSPEATAERQRQAREKWRRDDKLTQETYIKERYDRAAGDYCRNLRLTLEELAYNNEGAYPPVAAGEIQN